MSDQVTKMDNVNRRLLSLRMDERRELASSTSFLLVSKVTTEDSHPKEKKPAQQNR